MPVHIVNPFDVSVAPITTEAMVDTGADYCSMPAGWCQSLRLKRIDRTTVEFAGHPTGLPILTADVFVMQLSCDSIRPPVKTKVLGLEGASPELLLGRLTMEQLQVILAVDWPNKR